MYTLKITIKSLKNINNIKLKYLYKIKQFLKNYFKKRRYINKNIKHKSN